MTKFVGYCAPETLPIQPGMKVTIRKGTMVRCNGTETPAGKTYKVTVNHILPGQNECALHRSGLSVAKPPKVRWGAEGAYWSEVDINDIPEAL